MVELQTLRARRNRVPANRRVRDLRIDARAPRRAARLEDRVSLHRQIRDQINLQPDSTLTADPVPPNGEVGRVRDDVPDCVLEDVAFQPNIARETDDASESVPADVVPEHGHRARICDGEAVPIPVNRIVGDDDLGDPLNVDAVTLIVCDWYAPIDGIPSHVGPRTSAHTEARRAAPEHGVIAKLEGLDVSD